MADVVEVALGTAELLDGGTLEVDTVVIELVGGVWHAALADAAWPVKNEGSATTASTKAAANGATPNQAVQRPRLARRRSDDDAPVGRLRREVDLRPLMVDKTFLSGVGRRRASYQGENHAVSRPKQASLEMR